MKIAAIWWRVSTEDQRESNPDTQISEALAIAQEEGYCQRRVKMLRFRRPICYTLVEQPAR